jgi:hypothetical protein
MSPAQIKARERKVKNHLKNLNPETSYEMNNKKKEYVDTMPRME